MSDTEAATIWVNKPPQVLRIPADSYASSGCDRGHYVNWEHHQQSSLSSIEPLERIQRGIRTKYRGRSDLDRLKRELEQPYEFARKPDSELSFDSCGADGSRDRLE